MASKPNRYRRLHRLADALLEGPAFIRPPVSRDRDGYLARDFGIRLHLATPIPGKRMAIYRQPHQSIAVYTDATMNRARGFLPPIIRYATWDRLKDLPQLNDTDRPWPHVEVTLGAMANRRAVSALILKLQQRLRRVPFVPYFSARRGVAKTVGGGLPGVMRFFARNGIQLIEYGAFTDGPDRGLARLAIAGMQLLREQLNPFSLRGWKEFYEFTPPAGPTNTDLFWTWRYTRPGPRVAI